MWRIRYSLESVYNLFYYFLIVWKDRDFDFSFIDQILLVKLRKVYDRYSTQEFFEGQETTTVKPLRICIAILERRDNSFYWDMSNYDSDGTRDGFRWCYADLCEHRDHELLHDIMKKYKHYWWD